MVTKALVFTPEEIALIMSALEEKKQVRRRDLLHLIMEDADKDDHGNGLRSDIQRISSLQATIIKQLNE